MNDKDIKYDCSPFTKASGFTELMHVVMRNYLSFVENYVGDNFNKNKINDQNSQG
jgi:hypothetical protein